MNFEELIKAYNELINENTLLKAEIEKLRKNLNIPEPARPILNITAASTKAEINLPKVHNNSSPSQKIELFMSLFRGRTDVFARRWQSGKTGKGGYQPACGNEWRKGLCGKPKIKCSFCSNRKLIPLDKSIIEAHLRGESAVCKDIVGVYPLMPDETCYFLAADFDGENHQKDIAVFRGVCDELNISVAIERSRSGNGAHAWFFFDAAVSAA
ncbi:MAG TPA: helicase, partial [Candidatus Wallbacteria bacterium]|nr:helicase [Candidatus Wallbacteria bacterium]